MAMNKREQAELEGVRLRLALRWTGEIVGPDLPIPAVGEGRVPGWTFNKYTGRIEHAWSEAHVHGHGHTHSVSPQRTGIPQYSTRVLALEDLRRTVELEHAAELRAIDIQLDAAKRAARGGA